MARELNPADYEEVATPQAGPRVLNPDDYEEVGPKKPGYLESAARGIKQGATFGFGDEITGALEAAFTDKSYTQARDEARAADRAAREANPKTFAATEIGAGIAGSFVPGALGVNLIRGVGLGANIARGAAAGATAGAGSSEADLTKGDVGGLVKDTAIGGAIGGAVGGVLGTAAEKLIGGAPARVDKRLLGDIGHRANKGVRDRMAEMPEATRDTARAFGLDKVARDAPKLLEKSSAAKAEVGQKIGDTFDLVERTVGGVPIDNVLTALAKVEAKYVKRGALGEAKAVKKTADDLIEAFGDKAPTPDLHSFASDLGNRAFEGTAGINQSAAKRLGKDISRAVSGALKDHVKDAAKVSEEVAAAAKELPKLNQQYGALKEITTAATQRARLEPFPKTGLRSFTVKGMAEEAWGATGGKLVRPADVALAKLVKRAMAGDEAAKAAVKSLRSGAPTSLSANADEVPGLVTGIGGGLAFPSYEPY